MEARQGSQNNNPTVTWQSVFINNILDATEKYRVGEYFGSWDSMKALLAWMPEECYQECNPIFDKFEKDFKKSCTVIAYGYVTCYNRAQKTAASYLHLNLLELFRVARSSLEKNGWISKDFNIQPRNPNAKIRSLE
jgi:hypothetical protein